MITIFAFDNPPRWRANILGDLSDLALPFDKQSAIVSKLEAMLWP